MLTSIICTESDCLPLQPILGLIAIFCYFNWFWLLPFATSMDFVYPPLQSIWLWLAPLTIFIGTVCLPLQPILHLISSICNLYLFWLPPFATVFGSDCLSLLSLLVLFPTLCNLYWFWLLSFAIVIALIVSIGSGFPHCIFASDWLPSLGTYIALIASLCNLYCSYCLLCSL